MTNFRGVTRNINMKFGQLRRLADKVFQRTIITLHQGKGFNLDKIAEHKPIFDEAHHEFDCLGKYDQKNKAPIKALSSEITTTEKRSLITWEPKLKIFRTKKLQISANMNAKKLQSIVRNSFDFEENWLARKKYAAVTTAKIIGIVKMM